MATSRPDRPAAPQSRRRTEVGAGGRDRLDAGRSRARRIAHLRPVRCSDPRHLGGRQVARRRPVAVPERARHGHRHRALPAVPLGLRHRPEPAALVEHPRRAGRAGPAQRRGVARASSWSAPRSTRGARRSSASSSGRCSASCWRRVFVHSRLLERAFVPYVVASQTIPIVALAPMIVFAFGPNVTSVVVIATYLTFFPVTIAMIRGLRSPDPRALELMRSYAAGALGDLLEAPPAGVDAVPVHRAQDRRDRVASSARSSARGRAASRTASAARSSTSTSSTSPAPRSCGRRSWSPRCSAMTFFVMIRVAGARRVCAAQAAGAARE